MTSFKHLTFRRCVTLSPHVVTVGDTRPLSCLRHLLLWTWPPYPKPLHAALSLLVRVIRRSRPSGLSFWSLLGRNRLYGRAVACPQILF
jgi:hypothetical protein